MAVAEPVRMLTIGGVRYRPEVAIRLGLVDTAGELIPQGEPIGEPVDTVITSATAEGVPNAGHRADTDPPAPGEPGKARATPASGKRQRGSR